LIVVDMWTVDKRFLNDDCFKPVRGMNDSFVMKPVEQQILQDTTYFRVLNLATNTFNDARPSYYLKSVGGYSAAKLRRYQDLIDQHISKMNMGVLNMLNTKYFILKMNDGSEVIASTPTPKSFEDINQPNPDAFGVAWFVDSVLLVETPDDESAALATLDLRHVAVADRQFAEYLKDFTPHTASTGDTIMLYGDYQPGTLEYRVRSAQGGVAVFSEIYYPYGWKAYVDDKSVDIFRVNYLLRALVLPAGEHKVRFEFVPESIVRGDRLAIASLSVLALTILAGLWLGIKKIKNQFFDTTERKQ